MLDGQGVRNPESRQDPAHTEHEFVAAVEAQATVLPVVTWACPKDEFHLVSVFNAVDSQDEVWMPVSSAGFQKRSDPGLQFSEHFVLSVSVNLELQLFPVTLSTVDVLYRVRSELCVGDEGDVSSPLTEYREEDVDFHHEHVELLLASVDPHAVADIIRVCVEQKHHPLEDVFGQVAEDERAREEEGAQGEQKHHDVHLEKNQHANDNNEGHDAA
mmetsp:Transcript_238/g.756  ORF Transcript_238/g.756 Transcript_238/m.756 type:complete len:215 (-) Transcript_238:140-784(-)